MVKFLHRVIKHGEVEVHEEHHSAHEIVLVWTVTVRWCKKKKWEDLPDWSQFLHDRNFFILRSNTTSCQAWRCRCIWGATYYWSLQPLRYGQFLLPNPLQSSGTTLFWSLQRLSRSRSEKGSSCERLRAPKTDFNLASLVTSGTKEKHGTVSCPEAPWKRKTDQMVLLTRPESPRADPRRSFGCSTSGVGTRWWLRGTLGLPGWAKPTPS